MTSSFLDRQFCLTGQQVPNAAGRTPDNRCQRPTQEDFGKKKEAEGEKQSVDFSRSHLEQLWGKTVRRTSVTSSDLDLTPTTEASPWDDLGYERKDGRWPKEMKKRQTVSQLDTAVFQGGVRNKGKAEGGRRLTDLGSDSDSGNGTIPESPESPTREICLAAHGNSSEVNLSGESSVHVSARPSQKNAADNVRQTLEMPPSSNTDSWNSKETLNILCQTSPTSSKFLTDYDLKGPHAVPHSPRSPSSLNRFEFIGTAEMPEKERLHIPSTPSKAKENLKSESDGDNQFTYVGFNGSEDSDYYTLPVLGPSDQNNNCYKNNLSASTLDATPWTENERMHWPQDDPGLETRETQSDRRNINAKDNHLDVSVDMCHGINETLHGRLTYDHDTTRHSIQAKCQDMYGSRLSVHGSREMRSCQDIQGSYNLIHGSYHDVKNSRRDIQRSRFDLHDTLYDDCNISCGGHNGFKNSKDAIHECHDTRHDNNNIIQSNSPNYSRYFSLNDSISTASADCHPLPSNPDDQHGRRYRRRAAVGHALQDSPSKNHRYVKKVQESSFSLTTGSDSDLFQEQHNRNMMGFTRSPMAQTYRGNRSVSQDGASSNCNPWNVNPENTPPRNLSSHPALQQPYSDEVAVTLPRPNKPVRPLEVSSAVQTPVKGHDRPQYRRWTSEGLSHPEMVIVSNHIRSNTKPANEGRSGSGKHTRFQVPLFKSKRHSSNTSLGSGSGTAIKTSIKGGIETESVEDASLQSQNQGSTQFVFQSRGSNETLGQLPERSGQFLRSASVPNHERRSESSGFSLLEKIRSRLSSWKGPGPSKNHLSNTSATKSEQQERKRPDTVELSQNIREDRAELSDKILTGDEQNNPMARCKLPNDFNESTYQTTTFHTFQPLQSNQISVNKYNKNETSRKDTTTSTPSAAASVEKRVSFMEYQSCDENERTRMCSPSYEELDIMVQEVDTFVDFVERTVTSDSMSVERTITEAAFADYKQAMIIQMKEFIERCKRLVVKCPASETGFLQELSICRRSLDQVGERYRTLVDCTSLPSDREKVAARIIAVATSFKETATAASNVAGQTTRHPGMRQLRRMADRLVSDLIQLMTTVREMNYNRLSRRF